MFACAAVKIDVSGAEYSDMWITNNKCSRIHRSRVPDGSEFI